jgi:hypothetical protein
MVIAQQDIHEWHKVFVIFPRETINNELVFLQDVYRKWNYEKNSFADSSGYGGYSGGWDYKL